MATASQCNISLPHYQPPCKPGKNDTKLYLVKFKDGKQKQYATQGYARTKHKFNAGLFIKKEAKKIAKQARKQHLKKVRIKKVK